VLKGLLLKGIGSFDTLVLSDVREKDGSLMNSLEFPLYSFLFFSSGLAQDRRLNLVGDATAISQALRLLRITLIGPTRKELEEWKSVAGQAEEWLAVCDHLALKDKSGAIIQVEEFFNIIPFENETAVVGERTIKRQQPDVYEVINHSGNALIDLARDKKIYPPYEVEPDYVPGGLVKMGVEVLGGASGFSPTEPCTGLALCYNGEYLLIDSIPFLDQHLIARGISKNQIAAVFLTHLHDDHCSMFPLMMMPHRVEIITTREIFTMAMDKLACGLGWKKEAVEEHFKLVEVVPGEVFNYYGLNIEPHLTVYSIPTIGATFSTTSRGATQQMCVIGDNYSMTSIREMKKQSVVRSDTVNNLERLYKDSFNLLVADGGAGAIHGDPADAIQSVSDRVVFVHVAELPNRFNTTFSLASSGKRYTLIDGDRAIYTSQINHYLTEWLGKPFPNRWMRSLLVEEEVRRYNAEDVVIVQDTETRGHVYLILTGYCDVVRHDGNALRVTASLQAGDVIGEMAVITGSGVRSASVVARTPVTLCVFSEETFRSFIVTEGFKEDLLVRWSLRPAIKNQPQFSKFTSTVIERISQIAELKMLQSGESLQVDDTAWCLFSDGQATWGNQLMAVGDEYGGRPFAESRTGEIHSGSGCVLIFINLQKLHELRKEVPLLNYSLRKMRSLEADSEVDWQLGTVSIRD
jgi:CRP-like cAMP-binding protein